MIRLRHLVGLVALLGTACAGGTETGNPPVGVITLGLTAFSSAPRVASLETGQAGLSIDRADLNVKSFSLLPCAAGSGPLAVSTGEYNLVRGSATEVTGSQELCGLALGLSPATDSSAGVPAGLAIYLHGLRTDGSQFDVESTSARDIELHAVAASFGKQPLLLGFDVGTWFEGVDVHGAHAGGDGIARLDATLNPNLLTELEARTLASVRLYVDANANGILDASELTPVAAP